MPELLCIVRGKEACNKHPNKQIVICNNKDYTMRFDFDAEWEQFNQKTARFSYDGQYQDVVFSGNVCPVPAFNDIFQFSVGVFAGDLHTTTTALFYAKKDVLSEHGSPVAPAPDVYAQIMELLGHTVTESQLQEVITQTIEQAHASGEFDGVGITSAYVASNGHLMLLLSNGTTVDTGMVRGSDGAYVVDATVNAQSHLIITLSDGIVIDAGVVGGGGGGGDMTKHLLTLENGQIKDGGVALGFDALYAMLMVGSAFAVLVHDGHAYHPNEVTTEQIVFSSVRPVSGYITDYRVTMLKNGTVTETYGTAENSANRSQSIDQSTTKYPSNKAVYTAIQNIGDGIESYIASLLAMFAPVVNLSVLGLSSVPGQGVANSQRLQAVINSLSNSGGGRIYIPAGVWEFGKTAGNAIGNRCVKMASNVSIFGDGINSVLKVVGNTADGLDMFYFNDYADSNFQNPAYLENCTFADFVIDATATSVTNYTTAGKGFMFNLFRNCHWKNVTVKNTDATGFGVDCPIDSSMVDCVAIGCGKAAQTDSGGASGFGIGWGYSTSECMTIRGCRADGNKRYGIFFEHQRRFSSHYGADINRGFIVEGCTANGNFNNYGGIQGIGMMFADCHSSNAINHGYQLDNCTNSRVNNCYSNSEGNTSFVILAGGLGGSSAVDNVFVGCVSKYSLYGAKVVSLSDTAGNCKRNAIIGCYFNSEQTNNILTSGVQESLTISGNNATGSTNSMGATVTTLTEHSNSWKVFKAGTGISIGADGTISVSFPQAEGVDF